MSYYRVRRRSLLSTALVIGVFLLCLKFLFGRIIPQPIEDILVRTAPNSNALPCSQLPGANETLVILKTGSTELQDKLPIHFTTTLHCYPHYLIFSDYEEELEGHHIIDALDYVNPKIKEINTDFELWRRLQKEGRAALAPDELSGPESKVSPMTGKNYNPGWKLDKWKFMPMVNRTLNLYPDMKWYVFIETDTYLFWSTLLQWLATRDHNVPHYIGAQMQIGDIVFGHGGSGFAASHAAMRKVVNFYVENQQEWEHFTNQHWAGDCVLGKAFKDSGSPLQWGWPIIQGVKPGAIDYAKFDYGKRQWCYPTVSYHHMSSKEVEDIWQFEQEWIANGTQLLRHKDVFKHYILPHITSTGGTKTSWDNLGAKFDDEDIPDAASFEACREICAAKPECVQFAFSNGKCTTAESPRWGEANAEVQSGWFLDRVEGWMETMKPCEDELWV